MSFSVSYNIPSNFSVRLLPFVIVSLGPRALCTFGKAGPQSLTLDYRDIFKVKLPYSRISKAMWKDHSLLASLVDFSGK